jgi:hypothetical protein
MPWQKDMQTMNTSIAYETQLPTKLRFAGAIWTLVLVSPFIGEILSGSTRTSILFVFIPEMMVWGVGALLCRELVRRWRAGGVSLLLLGLAVSIAEEFIIQQTSLAPLPFPGSHAEYGRLWGLNLVYLLFMLGYESIWVVVVPVQLTELFFPMQANQPWLRMRGIIVSSIVFLLGCRIAWYGWTQQARPRLHAVPYHAPLTLLALGFVLIALLIVAAYFVRKFALPKSDDSLTTIPAWAAGLTAFVMGAAWFEVIAQIFVPHPVRPFWMVIIAGVVWAGIAFTLFTHWSSRPAWREIHGCSAAVGATLACMAAPYLTISTWPRVDVIGKISFDVMVVIGFLVLGRKVLGRSKTTRN